MSDPTPPPQDSEPTTGPVVAGPPPPPHQSATGPVVTGPPPPPGADGPPHTVYVRESSRVNKAAAWVGIAAGSVFVVAVIFGTGFIVGKHAGEGPRWTHGANEMVLRPGPAVMPMGPRSEFERGPAFSGPFGPGGPVIEIPRSPGGPDASGGPAATPRP